MYPLFKKIINANVGRSRYLMALVGLALGVILVLFAVQLRYDFKVLLEGENKKNGVNDFLVLNKMISPEMMAKGKEGTAFTNVEMDSITKQPFTLSCGQFIASQFDIYAELSWNIKGATDIYFEAINDKYLDAKPETFKWDSTQNEIPIIVYAGYLDQYNTAFVFTRNDLPVLSQESVMKIPLKITVGSKDKEQVFAGRIVGFSDRIQSFLVPESFMLWANKKFGDRPAKNPSRIVLETRDASNEALGMYLNKNNFKTNKDKTRFGQYKGLVNWAVQTISIIGFILLVFAIIIFGLFIELVVSHSRHDIYLLTVLGTSPKQLRGFLLKKFIPSMLVVIAIGLALVWIMQVAVSRFVITRYAVQLPPYLSIYTWAAAIILLVVLYLINSRSINKAIKGTNQ
jgi:ABC-type antimicrobial peptide transport system permease subunit